MKYLDTMERSAENLRAALPLMAKQRAALHPVSYAVWYEYISGTNPNLSRVMQALTRNGATLDEAQTRALFNEHVAEPDSEATRKLNDGFAQVIANMAESAAQAGQETARFDTSLTGWVEQLLDNPGKQTQAEVLQELLEGSREIRGAVGALQERLDASQCEIQRLREEVQRARDEAFMDALTGLANRRAFEQQLAACMNTPAGAHGPCLVMGDIDFFKRINDSYGHAFGDQVLRVVAQALKAVAAPNDAKPARVGGEEFAVLLASASLSQAQTLAEQMRQRVAGGRIRRGEQTQNIEQVTISLGVTQMIPGETAGDFFERADRALYASKRDGRNRVTVLQPGSDTAHGELSGGDYRTMLPSRRAGDMHA